jgi:hypothetical protein
MRVLESVLVAVYVGRKGSWLSLERRRSDRVQNRSRVEGKLSEVRRPRYPTCVTRNAGLTSFTCESLGKHVKVDCGFLLDFQ